MAGHVVGELLKPQIQTLPTVVSSLQDCTGSIPSFGCVSASEYRPLANPAKFSQRQLASSNAGVRPFSSTETSMRILGPPLSTRLPVSHLIDDRKERWTVVPGRASPAASEQAAEMLTAKTSSFEPVSGKGNGGANRNRRDSAADCRSHTNFVHRSKGFWPAVSIVSRDRRRAC